MEEIVFIIKLGFWDTRRANKLNGLSTNKFIKQVDIEGQKLQNSEPVASFLKLVNAKNVKYNVVKRLDEDMEGYNEYSHIELTYQVYTTSTKELNDHQILLDYFCRRYHPFESYDSEISYAPLKDYEHLL